jgi:PAS domain S-box-containing protein
VRSPENEELGIYALQKQPDGFLLVRIGLDQISRYLLRISEIMGATIIVASPDGFVYVCTDPTLSLSVVPEADGDIVRIDRAYLLTSRRSAQLNQNLIVLAPRDDVLAVLDSFKVYYPLFIIAILLIIGGKVLVQHVYIINPLQKFLVLMNGWNISTMNEQSASGTAILRTREIQDLYHTFVQKSLGMQAALREVQTKEEEMRRIRSYLKNIIDSMPSMLISIDEKGMVQEWNSAAQYFTGVTADSAIGRPFWDVYPELARYRHLCEQVITTGINHELKKEMIENGSRMFVNISLFPLVANGIKGMAIRLDDVTRMEHIEEQLRQAQKMETIGTLAGGLAHDFNNVLGGIVGTLSLMQYRLDTAGDLNPHRAELENELKTLNVSSARPPR